MLAPGIKSEGLSWRIMRIQSQRSHFLIVLVVATSPS